MSASLLIDGPGMWAFHVDLQSGKNEFTFGRSRGLDIVIPDDKVSSRHGSFSVQNGTWTLRDLKSSNGTFVNGVRTHEYILKNGDVLKAGDTDIVFRDHSQVDDDVWGKTVMRLNKTEMALRGTLEKASHSREEAVVIPDLELAPSPSTAPTIEFGDGAEPMTFDSDRYESQEQQPSDVSREDMLWIAEKLADVLGAIGLSGNKSPSALYAEVLGHLQQAINAENGFLMIPDRQTRRWVIKAHVGDSSEWTDYEKQRPVPLTVANRAYKEDKVVTNAFGKDRIQVPVSSSMMQLNVQFYIAVPLHRNGQKDGLMYFDTRRGLSGFTPRDVKLLERVGSYILELDRVVS